MVDNDKEYIMWLCKRLVYRYNEDPKILLDVESILEKTQTELQFYRQTHSIINDSIDKSIEHLNKIKTSYKTSIKDTQSQYAEQKIDKTMSTFENLDISEMLS